ncbi:MAG: hypothetical protein ACI8S6_005339 [Myxococcota bacterium]|jgi:hypothetical protein
MNTSLRYVGLLTLALLLSSCKHRDTASPIEVDWWMTPALSEVPLGKMVSLTIAGESWQEVAAALGLPAEDFDLANWSGTPIQVLDTDSQTTLGIYLEGDSEQARGILVRNKGLPFPTDVEGQLIAIASKSGCGKLWDLYVGGDYIRLVSQDRPMVELGCRTHPGAPICHAKVFSTTLGPEDFTRIRGNEDAQRTRSVEVR